MSAEHETQDTWFLDSGCSSHMTMNSKSFVELDRSYSSVVKLGDGKLKKVEGKGTIAVNTNGGNRKFIHDVLYVPSLSQNLLSVGQLLRKGYSLLFDDGECTIYDKKHKLTVAKVGMSRNNVFPLSMPSNEKIALKCEHVDDSHLWHLRYGHLNYQGLQLLKKRNMVVGLPSIQNNDRICEGCIYGKMHRLPFPKTAWRARAPLELVHSDICGPTRTPSLSNKRYFLLFVDDYTRMMWIYFLDQKSEAFTFFLQFKALVERQSGYQMKTLRTDRGGEFIYKPFW